jgi:uncharacterized protein
MNPVVHFEMPYQDAARVAEFYEKAFGWKMNKMGEEMGGYVTAGTTETDENRMVKTPGTINGGFYKTHGPQDRPNVVIAVQDIQAAIRKVNEAGGKVEGEPMPIPGIGTYFAFMDTEGNRVAVLEPMKR